MTRKTIVKLRSTIKKRRGLLVESEEIAALIKDLRPAARRGYLTKAEFLRICETKSSRRFAEAKRNSPKDIEMVTRAAYAVRDNHVRIRLLTALRGVEVPTASCLLAWVYPKRYGVIDVRAWRVLYKLNCVTSRKDGRGLQAPQWVEYHDILQELARSIGTTPRLIDHWLWQYYAEIFPKKRRKKIKNRGK